MASSSSIEWTDATWNPWIGCTQVSPGCAHCYMFRDQRRFGLDPELVRRGKTTFREPLRWKEPRRVFTCSWSDWFHEGADGWRNEAWDIIRRTPQHTYQILTKRPERIAEHLPLDWGRGYPNVWLGVSVETQRQAERITALMGIAAAVRFVSAEPLLGPLSLRWLAAWPENAPRTAMNLAAGATNHLDGLRRLDWVIVGGESGPGARPMRLEWAREVVRQCREAGVAVFVKQLGASPLDRFPDDTETPWPLRRMFGLTPEETAAVPLVLIDRKGGDPEEWPADLRIREFPTERTA